MTDAQQTAADPRVSAFVRANAGSGKTKTLIDRTARLLLAGAEPAKILCVTYTRAAAAEMQRRLFEKLGEWSVLGDGALKKELAKLEGREPETFDTGELSRARRLFAQALETPGGLKIQTIHAFCERLLRRFPLEAEVSPSFEVADDASAAALAAAARAGVAARVRKGDLPLLNDAYARMAVALDFEAFQKMFTAFEAERGGIRKWLNEIGGLTGLPAAVATLCDIDHIEDPAEVELAAVSPPALNPQDWFGAAKALAQGNEATDQPNGRKYQRVAELAAKGRPDLDTVKSLFLTDKGEIRTGRRFTKAVAEATREWILAEQERVIAELERAKAHRVAQDTVWVMTLAEVYLREYEAAKAARRVLDFADLVEKTQGLMENESAAWVHYKLDEGLDHILVDEAQDTAPDQWDIVRALASEFFSGAGRPINGPIARSLFVVGDNKQSIYSFQGAQPERLAIEIEDYVGLIGAAGQKAHKVSLLQSWRSTPEVMTLVDAVFAPDTPRLAIQPDGEPVEHHAGRTDGPGCIDLWTPVAEVAGTERSAWDAPLDEMAEDSANRRLARRIAAEIGELVTRGDGVFDRSVGEGGAWRPAGFGDVLILVRRRGQLFEEILRALKQQDIPVAGADRLALSAHIAFDDLLALARFALFPEDELTLAALLKSPFCGLDDDSLYALGHGRRKENLWRVLERRAGENGTWRIAFDFLSRVRMLARTRRPFDFYGRLLAATDERGLSGRQLLIGRLGAEAAEAIDEFLAQVQAAEQRGVRDLESLTHELGALDITVKRDMDEARGQVRVMTTHGAKGLEAPIVILPEMTWAWKPTTGSLLKPEDGGYLWCKSKAADCLPSRAAREAAENRLSEEQYRLLYVGITRARDRLILCGRMGVTQKTPGDWHLAVRAALDTLLEGGGPVRELGEGEDLITRFGEDPPRPASAAPAAANSNEGLPAWLFAPPPAEPEGIRYVSPSGLGEKAESAAVSPLSDAGGLGRFRRGTLIHKLLQILPDLAQAERAAAADKLLARESDLSEEQRAEMAGAALGVLNNPQFAGVFAEGSRAEVGIAGAAKGLPRGLAISGQVDRLVVTDEKVLVADFKTNRPAPGRIEDADPAYVTQMAAYVAALREAFPDKTVEAALIWTDGPSLMPVPEFLVSEALAELGRTS